MNEYPDIVPEESPLIILDSKSALFMANNGKDTKHTRYIARIVYVVSNFENCKIHKIDWCEGGLKLAEISTNNAGWNYLTLRMKCIVVRIDN